MTRVSDDHWLLTQPVAHRGLHNAAAGVIENSASAFEAAAQSGYAIECDLQLSKDGEAIVYHDRTLQRLTKDSARLSDRNATEICQLTLGDSHDRIQTLDAFLAQISGRVPLLIELKNSAPTAGLLERRTAEILSAYRGEFAVMSFNPRSVGWFAEHCPSFLRGQLSQKFTAAEYPKLGWWPRFAMTNLLLNGVSKPDFIGYDINGLPALAPRIAKMFGLPVLAWTVRSEDDWQRAKRSADNIIFESICPENGHARPTSSSNLNTSLA